MRCLPMAKIIFMIMKDDHKCLTRIYIYGKQKHTHQSSKMKASMNTTPPFKHTNTLQHNNTQTTKALSVTVVKILPFNKVISCNTTIR